MIGKEIHKLLDRGVIRPSTSPWAAQCLRQEKRWYLTTVFFYCRALDKLFVSDGGGLGDMQSFLDGLKGKR